MGAWVQPNVLSSSRCVQQLISHDDGGLDRSLNIDCRAPASLDVPTFSMFTGSNIASSHLYSSEWTFVAVTTVHLTSMTLYVHGVPTATTIPNHRVGFTYLRLASHPTRFDSEYFHGSMDSVFFFNRALSPAEVLAVYVATQPM
jgi:hypothetical protein